MRTIAMQLRQSQGTLAPSLVRPESPARVRRALDRANPEFAAHATVIDVIGGRLRDRLDVLATRPARVLDLGCRTGYQLAALAELYPQARITGVDPAPGVSPSRRGRWPLWPSGLWPRRPASGRVAADLHHLPFADASFDLVVSNLALPWCESPSAVFTEVARVLDADGALFFTAAGPDSLVEYRAVWAGVDGYPHAFGLVDMHDIGDAMLAAGFAAPVLDRDDVTVDYPSIDALDRELRGTGAVNLAVGRRHGLTAPSVRQRLSELAAEVSAPSGRFPVTLELVQGHGWKGQALPGANSRGTEQTIPLEQVMNSLKR